MRTTNFALCLTACALALSAPAQAASGKVTLQSDTASSSPATIEVQSWSWGVSNAGSGRRDIATGQASGKRQHEPVRVGGPVLVDGTITIVSPRDPASGQASGFTACAVGMHYQKIEVENANEKVSMQDLSVMRCDAGSMTLSYASATDQPVAGPVRVTKPRSNIQNN